MDSERSSNTIQIWFVITLAILVGISIYLFIATNNANYSDTPVNGSNTSDVPVAGERRCVDDGDCGAVQYCRATDGVCIDKRQIGSQCNRNAQCLNATCINNTCRGISCTADTECAASQFCATNVCREKRALGSTCSRNKQCASGFCGENVCRQSPAPTTDSTSTTTTTGTTNATTGGQTTGSTGIVPVTGFFDDPSGIISISLVCIFLGLLLYRSSRNLNDSEVLMNTSSNKKLKITSDAICDEYEKKFK